MRYLFSIPKHEIISVSYKDPFDPDELLIPIADQAKFDGMRIRAEEIEEDEFQEIVVSVDNASYKKTVSPPKNT